ncbi:MAG: glycosyl hydrolase 53 family protein [Clostridia bacterium]|nr:glycosyl hydrolase 53 family protein [Clostridia bacterium]
MKRFFISLILAAAICMSLFSGCGTADGVSVGKIEGLSDDYIMGVDLSSIIEVEEAGGVFYNEKGKEDDIFDILADYGVNYIRIRLWNDPYDEDGNSFGGGGNDLETDIAIAKRAVAAGMKVCLDFHYSDFWADPDKQTMPREWSEAGYTRDQISQVVYDYTYDVLMQFKEAGCLPSMVQTGNEINNGLIWDYGKAATWRCIYLYNAINAVKAVSEDILTVIHLANGATYSTISSYINQLEANSVNFDVIGLSYYSYWHGSMSKFQSCVDQLDANYDYDICVMEYSYGYGDVYNDYTSNIFSSSMEETGGYKATVQGQASYIHDVNEVVASASQGIGSFYWEPAWLPLEGTSWASTYAASYLAAQGDGGGEGTVSWANQALFDFDGHPLDSLKAFRLMRNSGTAQEEIVEMTTTISAMINLSKVSVSEIADNLPSATTALTTLDRWTEFDVTWNESDISVVTNAGTYRVTGTVTAGGIDYTITAYLTCYYDFLQNGGFEEDGISSDVTDFSNITGWEASGTSGSYRIETKNSRSGSANLNIWCSSDFENDVCQTTTLPAGTYTFSVYGRSGNCTLPDCVLYVSANGTDIATETIVFGSSWSDWVQTTVTFTVTETTTVAVGVRSSGYASDSWAHFDDFALAATN